VSLAVFLAAVIAGSNPSGDGLKHAVLAVPSSARTDGDVVRAADGLFYVSGTVNGVQVRFLVDTGASATVLTHEDAIRAGVLPVVAEFHNVADTANGASSVTWVKVGELQVAGLHVRGMSAAVSSGGLKISLLGQDWLSWLDSVTITGDRMVLRY
jgi:aspartyl protease family protein